MERIYIQKNDGTILELTVTTSISVANDSEVTQHPLENGDEITDNVVNKNKQITFSGMISDIRSYKGNAFGVNIPLVSSILPQEFTGLSVDKYLQEMDALKDSKELFTIIFDTRIYGKGLSNCLFNTFTYEKEVGIGSAYMVTIGVTQVRIGSGLDFFVNGRQVNPSVTDPEGTGSNTSTVNDPDRSLVKKVIDVLFG